MYFSNSIFHGISSIAIDGCFFGTSFPMEFLVHFPEFVPTSPLEVYKPRLFGFAVSKESPAYRSDKKEEVTFWSFCSFCSFWSDLRRIYWLISGDMLILQLNYSVITWWKWCYVCSEFSVELTCDELIHKDVYLMKRLFSHFFV